MGLCSPHHPAPSSGPPQHSAGSPPESNERTRSLAPLCREDYGLSKGKEWKCAHGGFHLQLFGGLPVEGALLSPLFLLLILQLLGYTDVVLHKLVLLDIGGVVLLNYRLEKGNVSRLLAVYRPFLIRRSALCGCAARAGRCTYSPVPAGCAPALRPPAQRNTGTLKQSTAAPQHQKQQPQCAEVSSSFITSAPAANNQHCVRRPAQSDTQTRTGTA